VFYKGQRQGAGTTASDKGQAQRPGTIAGRAGTTARN